MNAEQCSENGIHLVPWKPSMYKVFHTDVQGYWLTWIQTIPQTTSLQTQLAFGSVVLSFVPILQLRRFIMLPSVILQSLNLIFSVRLPSICTCYTAELVLDNKSPAGRWVLTFKKLKAVAATAAFVNRWGFLELENVEVYRRGSKVNGASCKQRRWVWNW